MPAKTKAGRVGLVGDDWFVCLLIYGIISFRFDSFSYSHKLYCSSNPYLPGSMLIYQRVLLSGCDHGRIVQVYDDKIEDKAQKTLQSQMRKDLCWLVVWNMTLIVHFIYGMSSHPLTNSYFPDG